MVSTRSHPTTFPPPDLSPSKSRLSSSTPEPTSSPTTSKSASTTARRTASSRKPKSPRHAWSHTPSHTVLLWLTLSLPLVAWDTGYLLLRPHSMPGGSLHAPVWKPYAIYSTVDLVYGFPAYESHDGFPAAQAVLNIVESLVYAAYLLVVGMWGVEDGRQRGRGGVGLWERSWWGRARVLGGRAAGVASLLGFGGSLMTLSKTLLYALNESQSGFKHTRHNPFMDLLFYYIIPNGAWLVFSAWMTYVFGVEILEGLAVAAGEDVDGNRVLSLKDE